MKTLHESISQTGVHEGSILDKRNKKDTTAGYAPQIASYLNECHSKAKGNGFGRYRKESEDWEPNVDVFVDGSTCTLKHDVQITAWHSQPQYITFVGLLKKLKIRKLVIEGRATSWLWEDNLEDFEIECSGSLSLNGNNPKISNCKITCANNLRFLANKNDIQDCVLDAFLCVIDIDYGVISRGNKFIRCIPEYKTTSGSDAAKAIMKFRKAYKKGDEPHIRDIIQGISVGRNPVMIEYSRSGSTTNSFYIYVSMDESQIDQVTNWQYKKVYSDGYHTSWGLQKGMSMRDPFA